LEAAKLYIDYKNQFLKSITEKKNLQNWVDIEEEYYEQLKICVINNQIEEVEKLNSDFKQIKDELEKYLKQEYRTRFKPTDIQNKHSYYNLLRIIDSEFEKKDFTTEIASGKPKKILFVNFNYTSIENLYRSPNLRFDDDSIHIHGELYDDKNPIIFGYGDEMDGDYKMLEKKSVGKNFILENMKSVNYSKTNNYSEILRLINSDLYQIFIMGHSCGNSDRTLLNKLFEHKNCVSIKPYCYIDKNGKSDYIDKYINISRHFNDKHLLRERVVNESDCDLMLQFKI
jgi:succinate dehydrogenase flavin-adding protein (antitoxin of CptAB toxin-antitoxin module)